MPGVRRKKSRRNAVIKNLKGMRKRKKLVDPSIGDETLKKHWDKSKTLKQNMKHLGLAFNSNKSNTSGMSKRKKITKKGMLTQNLLDDNGMVMDVVEEPINSAVIDEFSKQAANGKKTERHISPGEAKFFMELIQKHSTNYKAMARDKRNTYQHTPKQLQRKCEGLLTSSLLPKYKEMYPGILPDDVTTEEMESIES